MRYNLEATLPKNISIGAFRINVEPLRQFLVNKRKTLENDLLVMFTDTLRDQTREVLAEYAEIQRKLREEPKSIEEVFEIRDWMDTVPLSVKNLNDTMQRLKFEYDMLDTFWWNLSDDDFQTKWEAIEYPLEIERQVKRNSIVTYLKDFLSISQ